MNVITPVTTNSIEHALLIEIEILATSPPDGFGNTTTTMVPLHYTTAFKNITYNGYTYETTNGLLGVSDITDSLTGTEAELSIVLTGINDSYVETILDAQIKGSPIAIHRVFFNPNGNQTQVSGTSVFRRFSGMVTNYNIAEDLDLKQYNTANSYYTITLQCSSSMGVLNKKKSGRRTNPSDYKIYYSELAALGATTGGGALPIESDPSFDRILTLHNSSFDFGKPYTAKTTNNGRGGNTGGGSNGNFNDDNVAT
jgi:hypothetical protein